MAVMLHIVRTYVSLGWWRERESLKPGRRLQAGPIFATSTLDIHTQNRGTI